MEITTRNQDIRGAIEREKIPILPFELEVAQNALRAHVKKQEELGRQMGEAMQQSSETWHDNAPAEAIANDSKALAASAEKTMQIINESEIFNYSPEIGKVTLGSLVEVVYGTGSEVAKLYLTGVVRELPSSLKNSMDSEEIECVTISSPVGKAIFDQQINDRVNVKISEGRQINITIVSISPGE